MTAPFGFTCTFITRTDSGSKDAHGKVIYTETSTLVPGCVVAPGASTETLGSQDTVDALMTLYAPTGTSVAAVDAVVVPGYGTFEIDGQPEAWPVHPRTGWQPSNSLIVRLRKVAG